MALPCPQKKLEWGTMPTIIIDEGDPDLKQTETQLRGNERRARGGTETKKKRREEILNMRVPAQPVQRSLTFFQASSWGGVMAGR